MNVVRRCLLACALFVALALPAFAHGPDPVEEGAASEGGLPPILQNATFEQNLGGTLPLDATFTNEAGEAVQLGTLFGRGRPVLLTMNYFQCENLCPLLLDGLVRGLNGVAFNIGADFDVLSVSIDEREGPTQATEAKDIYVARYGRSEAARRWSFLTGTHEQIDALAAAAGVRYDWDERQQEFAHPSGVIVLTPDGTISRYIYGIDFNPRDLRLALVEASEGKIGSPVDQILLFCYQYDPTVGQYTPLVFNIMKLGGAVTLVVVSLFLLVLIRGERRRAPLKPSGAPS